MSGQFRALTWTEMGKTETNQRDRKAEPELLLGGQEGRFEPVN